MEVISFFNNKGGVGKTTLSINIASYIAKNKSKKILFIDADPQSNSTQMILSDEWNEKIYKEDSKYDTLYSCLKPLIMGEPDINKEIKPIDKESSRFSIDLIPGHPKISLIEDILSEAWANCRGEKLGGFRITNWLKSLINIFNNEYDIAFIDLGPSLGALNRSILLNSDFFIAPMGCDIFSLMGIENIATWIQTWKRSYIKSVENIEEIYPEEIKTYDISTNIESNCRLLGFSVQQYITKVIQGERRPIKAYDEIMVSVPITIEKCLKDLFPPGISVKELSLGDIPHLYSLIPLAQTNNCPIHDLCSQDGVVGNHYKMINQYKDLMDSICTKLLYNMGEKNE